MANELSGTLLGRYELQARLGRGGMGDVYKGRDSTLDRPVAIKVLHGHLADEADFKQRFEREAKAIAALDHPGIVKVYDYGYDQQQGIYAIVLQYLPSDTLHDRMLALRGQPVAIRLQEARKIFPPLGKAVAYAHAQGMVHRDIKPANILFTESGEPVLADFGLVHIVTSDRLTMTGTATGTPSYMAPEQGIGEAGDKRSDIYSLGVILFEMLAGMVPFTAETPFGLIMKHVNEPVPSLTAQHNDLPPALEVVVNRAMAKRAEQRYQKVEDLVTDLFSALDKGEVSQDTFKISSPTIRIQSRPLEISPLAWVGLGIVMALGLIGALFVAGELGGGREADPATPLVTQGADEIPSMTDGEDEIPSMAMPVEMTDDFSDPATGWPVQDAGGVSYGYDAGVYRFRNTLPGQARLAVFDEVYTYTGTHAEVEAALVDGQPESGFGLVFRWLENEGFYVFAINGEGAISMWAFEDNSWRELRGLNQQWTPSEAVFTDGRANLIGVVADGDHLIGLVNGEIVIDVTDDTFDMGAVGFYVATTQGQVDGVLAEVEFDNFFVEPSIPAMTDTQVQ